MASVDVHTGDLITAAEAAKILNVSRRTILNYHASGKFGAHKFSARKTLFKLAEILEFKNRTYQEPTLFDL